MLAIEPPRPVNARGKKCTECPFYERCLSDAARQNWSFWSCGECGNGGMVPFYRKIKLIDEHYDFLAGIYPEFRKRYEKVIDAYRRPDFLREKDGGKRFPQARH